MSRAKWKGYFNDLSIFRNKKIETKKIIIWSRRSTIPFFFLNKTVFIHNGNTFKKILITREKIGYKFGEFVFTKIIAKPKKTTKKKK